MQTKHELIPEPIGLDVDALPRPLDWQQLYGNANPVELEIGMGKGTFLTEQARARPEVNFFGIEWQRWYWRYASDRLRRNGCTNARTVRAEASFFLTSSCRRRASRFFTSIFRTPGPKRGTTSGG
jgi:tRNA (guanine-N7-)-methyltransferase